MRLAAGRRNKLVTFQARTKGRSATYGTTTASNWADLAENPQEWAEVQDILPSRSESVSEGINLARRPARIRIAWRDDITGDMRVIVEGRDKPMQIVGGPAELGFRDGLEMVCEELSTEGERP